MRGHRVASGACGDPRFPDGTIAPQLGPFRERIAVFDGWLGGDAYPATINLAFAGCRIVAGEPDFRIGPLCWTDCFPPETFLISRCTIEHRAKRYPAFVYMPDPGTKPDHHQAADIVEILTCFVPGLAYGDSVRLLCSPRAVAIVPAG